LHKALTLTVCEPNNAGLGYPTRSNYRCCGTELERTQSAARDLEEKVKEVDRDREKLEEAKRSAEESVRLAEEAANVEKAERQLKAT